MAACMVRGVAALHTATEFRCCPLRCVHFGPRQLKMKLLSGFSQSPSVFPTRLRPPATGAPAVDRHCLAFRIDCDIWLRSFRRQAFREGRRFRQVSLERLATSAFSNHIQAQNSDGEGISLGVHSDLRFRDSGLRFCPRIARLRPILDRGFDDFVTLQITTRARLRSHSGAKAWPGAERFSGSLQALPGPFPPPGRWCRLLRSSGTKSRLRVRRSDRALGPTRFGLVRERHAVPIDPPAIWSPLRFR